MRFPSLESRLRMTKRITAAVIVALAMALSFIAGVEYSSHGYRKALNGPTDQSEQTSTGVDSSSEKGQDKLEGTDFIVIGDSYHASDTTPYHEAAEHLADISGMRLHNYAVGGTGWLASAFHEGRNWTFSTQIAQAIDDSADFAGKVAFILVAGGYNDANAEAYDQQYDKLTEAMTEGFHQLREAFPEAKIVYVPYLRANNPMLPDYFSLDSVHVAVRAAERADVVVAPYAWEWNLGQDQFFDAKRDPVHPCSEDGFAYIAQKEWEIVQGRSVPRETASKKFSGITEDGLLEYTMTITLSKGTIRGHVAITPLQTFVPNDAISIASSTGYTQLTPNSSLWNVFNGRKARIAKEASIAVSTSTNDADDAFVLTGGGTLRKGKQYKVTFEED